MGDTDKLGMGGGEWAMAVAKRNTQKGAIE